MSNGQTKLFPAWDLAGRSYRALFDNFGYALKICWAWVVVMASAIVAGDLIRSGSGVAASGEEASSNYFLAFCLWLLLFAALSSIAVAWHRMLLLGERDSSAVYLRMDKLVAIYYGFALLVFLISLTPYAAVWGLGQLLKLTDTMIFSPGADGRTPVDYLFSQQGLLGFPLLQIAAFIVLVMLTARLGVALPGKALQAAEGTLTGAWRITRGSSWGLFVGTGICVLPYVILVGMLRGTGFDFSPSDGSLLHVLDRLAIQALSILLGLVEVGFLAHCFLYFFPKSKAVVRTE